MEKCPKCGYENEDEKLSCNLCSEVLRKEKPAEKAPPLPQEKKKGLSPLLASVIILALLAGIGYFAISPEKPPAGDLGETGIRSIKGGLDGTLSINYAYFIPAKLRNRKEPARILGIIPGMNGPGGMQVQGPWAEFAAKNDFVIISPSFLCPADMNDYMKGVSYQFPGSWSGKAFLDMVDDLNSYRPVRKDGLSLIGWSAGAQFSTRFALLHPDLCAAVAAHAAGGYTSPDRKIPVKFFISVGSEDTDRKVQASRFRDELSSMGIANAFRVYDGLGHDLKEEQVNDLLGFIAGLM